MLWRAVFGLLAVVALVAVVMMTMNVMPPWPVKGLLLIAIITGLILRVRV